jgi:DHA1 family inner membrane transport protein
MSRASVPPADPDRAGPAPSATHAAHWGGFALTCGAYLAASVGESLLSPVFPTAADDLGLDLTLGGVAFGVLTATIAVANIVGGALLPRLGATRVIRLAVVLSAAGALVAATAKAFPQLALAQVLLGAGSGLYFPAGIQAVAALAGPRRKGFAMGMFGVAFSGGLTIAAVLAAVGATHGWRTAFVVSAVLSAIAALSTLALRTPPVPPVAARARVRDVLGMPTAVGTVGAVCQYGTVSFLTAFAVREWGLTLGAAAAVLAVGRVLSIAAKVLSGAAADRRGPRASARRIGAVLAVTGVGWVLLPGSWPAYALAAVFAGTVSSVFPVANVLALERFGGQGGALGLYRSVQIALGALATFLVGVLGDAVGLRPVLAVTVLVPLLLFRICREPTDDPVAAVTAAAAPDPGVARQ